VQVAATAVAVDAISRFHRVKGDSFRGILTGGSLALASAAGASASASAFAVLWHALANSSAAQHMAVPTT